jgi:hypothetical protein
VSRAQGQRPACGGSATAPAPEALARDHQIGRATAYRYVDEVIDVLAAEAPDLHEALDRARGAGRTYNTLHHVTVSPGKIGDIVRAALVLTFRPGLLV